MPVTKIYIIIIIMQFSKTVFQKGDARDQALSKLRDAW